MPHFQQPGQAYFVTWCLIDAVPQKAFVTHTHQLETLKTEIALAKQRNEDKALLDEMLMQFYIARKKYIKAFDDLLDLQQHKSELNLSLPQLTETLKATLLYFEGEKIENYAFCIMPDHVHWVFRTFEQDTDGNPVYIQDIMQSIKRFSANRINEIVGSKGSIWQKESFDSTIRDEKHLYNAIEYTLNNPVKANLVKNREDWPGNWWK